MIICAIDIETRPAPGFEDYDKAALDHHRNEITKIALATSKGGSTCFDDVETFNVWLRALREVHNNPLDPPIFVGHNFKFDLKTLITKGAALTIEDYHHDTMLQAVANVDKIPDQWLADYGVARLQANKDAGANIHRDAGRYSLKTLAPYHLDIAPFWEVADHADAAYAIKDAVYTLQLFIKQAEVLKQNDCAAFYNNKLMQWARMILEAELRGVAIDMPMLEARKANSLAMADKWRGELLELWQEPMEAYGKQQAGQVDYQYAAMKEKALAKAKPEKKEAVAVRYDNLASAARDKLEPFNIDSPSQLMWLLKEYYGLDTTTFEGDESTGKSVLNRLASEGRTDITALLEYRKHTKLSQAFFPSYESMQWEKRLYCSFNLNGTRTGRLSSSDPNLQQVPGDLHSLFIAGPGRKLICYDLSNIEPMLLAYVTECPKLCKLVIEGRNFHDVNTKVFFDLPDMPDADIKTLHARERKVSKELGLLLLYGGGKKKIRESAQKYGFQFSMAVCEQMYNRFRKEYEAVFAFKKQLDRRLEAGEAIESLLGRQYKLPNRDDVYMKGLNTLIQSSASDLLVESASRAYKRFYKENLAFRPILFVHDEVILEGPEHEAKAAADILLEEMLGYTLTTPHGTIKLKAEGGIYDNWQKG